VWSKSVASSHLAQVFENPLPFYRPKEWSKEKLAFALQFWLPDVIGKALVKSSACDLSAAVCSMLFVKSKLRREFMPLFLDQGSNHSCGTMSQSGIAQLLET